MKIHQVGAELFREITKLIVAFCNFVNAPTNDYRTCSH
jgi:hypothetical protein